MNFNNIFQEIWYCLEISKGIKGILTKMKKKNDKNIFIKVENKKVSTLKKKKKNSSKFFKISLEKRTQFLYSYCFESEIEAWLFILNKFRENSYFEINKQNFLNYIKNFINIEIRNLIKKCEIIEIISKMSKSSQIIEKNKNDKNFLENSLNKAFNDKLDNSMKESVLDQDSIFVLDNNYIIYNYSTN